MLNNQMVGDWDRNSFLHRIYRTKHQVRIMNHAKWSTMMNSRYVHGISQQRSLIYCSLFQYQLIGDTGIPKNKDRQPDKGPDLFSQKTSWRRDRAETWISEWSKAHLKRAKEKHQENQWITISAYKQLTCQYMSWCSWWWMGPNFGQQKFGSENMATSFRLQCHDQSIEAVGILTGLSVFS